MNSDPFQGETNSTPFPLSSVDKVNAEDTQIDVLPEENEMLSLVSLHTFEDDSKPVDMDNSVPNNTSDENDHMPLWLQSASEELEQKPEKSVQIDAILAHLKSIEQIVTTLHSPKTDIPRKKDMPIQRLEESARNRSRRR
jgi:hypothetical protein